LNIFELLWSLLVAECDELGLVNWEWQAADCALGKARSGGEEVGPNPTDRAKNGTKRSWLVEADGGPLGAVVAPANQNDQLLLSETIEALVVERPRPTPDEPQHLCLDGGYHNEPAREVVKEHGYQGHIRPGGVEPEIPKGEPKHPPRRWVVERTLAW